MEGMTMLKPNCALRRISSRDIPLEFQTALEFKSSLATMEPKCPTLSQEPPRIREVYLLILSCKFNVEVEVQEDFALDVIVKQATLAVHATSLDQERSARNVPPFSLPNCSLPSL